MTGLALWAVLAASAAAPVELPLTIEQVWFRTVRGKAWIRLARAGGDLTVRPDALSFSTGKKTTELAIDRIRILSYGKIAGDVDTDWALLGIGDEYTESIVAIRDGRKLGYGQRTAEIHTRLREALRTIGAAQYRVPPGFRAFDGFDDQFCLAYPETFEAYVDDLVVVGDGAPWGTIVFSSEPIRDRAADSPTTDRAALARAFGGELPAFFVERLPAPAGMSCSGFNDKASQRLLEMASAGELSPGGAGIAQLESTAPERIDICNGVRLRGTASASVHIELHAVASRGTLFVFGMRAAPPHLEQTRGVLEAVLGTVQFSIAQ